METAIIIAIIGGAGGFISAITTALFKFLEWRKAKNGETLEAKLQPLLDKLDTQDQELREIRLDTLRTQLYIKMEHEPHNHDTILTIAHKYFVEYRGDWVVTTDFQRWADRENLKVPGAILQAIAHNDKR